MFDSTEDIQKLAFPHEYSLSKEQLFYLKRSTLNLNLWDLNMS